VNKKRKKYNSTVGIEPKLCSLPILKLHRGVFSRLLKVAAFQGIPAQYLAESAIIKFVERHWDREQQKPK
jgi:hypothetical protein